MRFEFLLWSIFNQYVGGSYGVNGLGDLAWTRLGWTTILVIPTMVGSTMLGYSAFWPLLFVPIVISVLLVAFGPVLGRLHPLNKIDRYVMGYSPHSVENRAWILGKQYLELSEKDKCQFPINIIDVLANPDLTGDKRTQLFAAMDNTFDALKRRDAVRNRVIKRSIDISSVLEYMTDQRQGIEIETNTYKQLMD